MVAFELVLSDVTKERDANKVRTVNILVDFLTTGSRRSRKGGFSDAHRYFGFAEFLVPLTYSIKISFVIVTRMRRVESAVLKECQLVTERCSTTRLEGTTLKHG